MKRKKKTYLTCLIWTVGLLVLCMNGRNQASEEAFTSLQASDDPAWEKIFGSREFSNLVVSIQGDEKGLYSEESGILNTQYEQQGMEGERQIMIFVYDKNGKPLIAQKAGIRVSGAASRAAARKSFRIIARSEYDERYPKFRYDLWGGRTTSDGSQKPIREYSSFLLHSVRKAMDATGIHNSVGYALARKAGLADASPTVPAAVYINGKYQGAYFIMQAKTDNAFAEMYQVENQEDIELVTVFAEEKTGYQKSPEVLQKYIKFVEFVQNSDTNDGTVVREIERQMDVEQYLRYCAVNLLLANGDWLDNNLLVWRCKDKGLPYQDGKWRYYIFDLDWIGSFPDYTPMIFPEVVLSDAHYNLLPSLLRNPAYFTRFREILTELGETVFTPETIEKVFAEEQARMADEISYDIQSEAFTTYLQTYSYSSVPEEDEYIAMEDWYFMIEDFKSHMLKAPGKVEECMAVYFP